MSRTPMIAIGLAAAALVVAVIAALGVGRHGDAPLERADEVSAAATSVSRADLFAFATEIDTDAKSRSIVGPRLDDRAHSLGLERGDAIVALNGVRATSSVRAALRKLAAAAPKTLFVEIERRGVARVVRWNLAEELTAELASPDAFPGPPDPNDADLVPTIGRLGKRAYHLPRTTIEALLAEPSAHGVRLATHVEDGHLDGLDLTGVRPRSVAEALGFQNGDRVRAINGYPLTSPPQALQVYARVKDSPQISIDLVRNGDAMIFSYVIE